MSMRTITIAALGGLLAAPAFALQAVALQGSFAQPVFLTAPAGDARIFVVEKGGVIKVIAGGVASTYLDISARVNAAGERGLLGLAFDPGFSTNGRFYVNYIDETAQHNTVVAAFTAPSAASNSADPASEQHILTISQPGQTNHKGGWIGFRGSDPGQLYIAAGDGGGSDDPQNRAQNLSDNLGKMLRITPSTTGTGYTIPASNPYVGVAGNDEIWSYGLRNPYRNSFDRITGDLWIADVGQNRREEINFEVAGSGGGNNYGWRSREGTIDNPAVPDAPPVGARDPMFEYAHSGGLGESIIGGYVYRGSGEPGLDGSYFFGDYVSGRIFTLRQSGGVAFDLTERTAELGTPFGAFELSSFGEDGLGNLYAVGINGDIYRIAAAVPEPGAWAMLLAGGLVLAGCVRRRGGRA